VAIAISSSCRLAVNTPWRDARLCRRGSLSPAAIQRTRGFSKRRLAELTPLVLGWRPSLELRVHGKSQTFRALPRGSLELAARISSINRSVEDKVRAAWGSAKSTESRRRSVCHE